MSTPDTADVPGMVLLRPFQPLIFCFCQRDISASQQMMLPSPTCHSCAAFKAPSLTVTTWLISCTSCYHQAVCFPKCKFLNPSVATSHPSHFNYIKKYIFCMCVYTYTRTNIETTAPSQRLILCEKLSCYIPLPQA